MFKLLRERYGPKPLTQTASTATEASTQTPPQKPAPTNNSVSTNTGTPANKPQSSTRKSYAEAATQHSRAHRTSPASESRTRTEKGKGKEQAADTPRRPPRPAEPSTPERTVVLHAAPVKYKAGQLRRWIEEGLPQIFGTRWLVQEHRWVGKLASSLVIYMKEGIDLNSGLQIGRRISRTTAYDWYNIVAECGVDSSMMYIVERKKERSRCGSEVGSSSQTFTRGCAPSPYAIA